MIEREQLGVFDRDPLGVAEQLARAVPGDLAVQLAGDSLLRARRSSITQSVRAVVYLRNLVPRELGDAGRQRLVLVDSGCEGVYRGAVYGTQVPGALTLGTTIVE